MSFWIHLCTEVWNASPWNASLREFIVTEWMRVEGVCGGHLVQPSCLYQDTCLFPRIISRDSFNILKEPDSITFLDSHGSVTPAVKKSLPDVQRPSPIFQCVPTASCLFTEHHWKDTGSLLFALSLQVCMWAARYINVQNLPEALVDNIPSINKASRFLLGA